MSSASVLVVIRTYTKVGSARNIGQRVHTNALMKAATILYEKQVGSAVRDIARSYMLTPMSSASVLVVTRTYTKVGSAMNTGQQIHANVLMKAATNLQKKQVGSAGCMTRSHVLTPLSASVLVVTRTYTKVGTVRNIGQQVHANALMKAATIMYNEMVSAVHIARSYILMPMSSASVLVVTRTYTKVGSARNIGQQVHANALTKAATNL